MKHYSLGTQLSMVLTLVIALLAHFVWQDYETAEFLLLVAILNGVVLRNE